MQTLAAAKKIIQTSPSLSKFQAAGVLPWFDNVGRLKHFSGVRDPHLWTEYLNEDGSTHSWGKG